MDLEQHVSDLAPLIGSGQLQRYQILVHCDLVGQAQQLPLADCERSGEIANLPQHALILYRFARWRKPLLWSQAFGVPQPGRQARGFPNDYRCCNA
jgi:hypothetical protein